MAFRVKTMGTRRPFMQDVLFLAIGMAALGLCAAYAFALKRL